jgi:hypothetical protein
MYFVMAAERLASRFSHPRPTRVLRADTSLLVRPDRIRLTTAGHRAR